MKAGESLNSAETGAGDGAPGSRVIFVWSLVTITIRAVKVAEKSRTLVMTSIFRQSRKPAAEDGGGGGGGVAVDSGIGSDLPVSGSGFSVDAIKCILLCDSDAGFSFG